MKFDPWVWHKKRGDNRFSGFFSGMVLGFSYAPLKFSKEKKIMATSPKPFDGIP